MSVQISLGQTDKPVLDSILNFLQAQNICAFVCERREVKKIAAGQKPMFQLGVANRKNAVPFLSAIIPHLHVKRVKAEDALRFLVIFPPMLRGKHVEDRMRLQFRNAQQKFLARAA